MKKQTAVLSLVIALAAGAAPAFAQQKMDGMKGMDMGSEKAMPAAKTTHKGVVRRAAYAQLHRRVSAVADDMIPPGAAAQAETKFGQQRGRKHVRVIQAAQFPIVPARALEDPQIASRPRGIAPAKALSKANGHAVHAGKAMIDLPDKAVPVVYVIRRSDVVVTRGNAIRQGIV